LWRRYIVHDLPVFARMLRRPAATVVDSMDPMPTPPVPLAHERDVPVALLEQAVGGS
jgi:hypothetical protein